MAQEKFMVQVKVFGLFREAVGKKEVAVTLNGDVTVADLRKQLSASYPKLASAKAFFIVAVNRRIGPDTAKVKSGDELAIMPLVSGG